MKVEKGQVRAPEIGRTWLNSSPLSLRQLRGKVVLIDFWDYTCVNCIRTLPYVQEWHKKYKDLGLVVIGVHTPEFTFAQYEPNVERGVREFGLTYPIVVDSDYELWKAFANRYWPAKYLLDKDGYLREVHFGEGGYREFETVIQELLREADPDVKLPALMEPVRESDREGAVCYRPSAELYLGNRRGRIGNEGGFKEDTVGDYEFHGEMQPNVFYANGRFESAAEYFGTAGEGEHRIALQYEAAGVNLVLGADKGREIEVEVRQDGKPLTQAQATDDTKFRGGRSYVAVGNPRMYALVDNHDFGAHVLELICMKPGLAAFAFTFTSCVDPAARRPEAVNE